MVQSLLPGSEGPGEKNDVVPEKSSEFGDRIMVVGAMNIRGICYYETFAENEIINTARYFEFLKRPVARWRENRSHAILIAMPQLFPGLSKKVSNMRFKLLIFSFRAITDLLSTNAQAYSTIGLGSHT